jgi:hypothetical protein
MKTAIWILTGVAVAFVAYSIAPDLVRYMKMRSM